MHVNCNYPRETLTQMGFTSYKIFWWTRKHLKKAAKCPSVIQRKWDATNWPRLWLNKFRVNAIMNYLPVNHAANFSLMKQWSLLMFTSQAPLLITRNCFITFTQGLFFGMGEFTKKLATPKPNPIGTLILKNPSHNTAKHINVNECLINFYPCK